MLTYVGGSRRRLFVRSTPTHVVEIVVSDLDGASIACTRLGGIIVLRPGQGASIARLGPSGELDGEARWPLDRTLGPYPHLHPSVDRLAVVYDGPGDALGVDLAPMWEAADAETENTNPPVWLADEP